MIQWYITKFVDYKFLLQNSGFRWPHIFIQPILQTFIFKRHWWPWGERLRPCSHQCVPQDCQFSAWGPWRNPQFFSAFHFWMLTCQGDSCGILGRKNGSKPWVLEDVSPPNQEPIRTFLLFQKITNINESLWLVARRVTWESVCFRWE